jgi:hypothetical protein
METMMWEKLVISSEVELSLDIFIEAGLRDQGLQGIRHGGIDSMAYFEK